jgi:hypothetical protein
MEFAPMEHANPPNLMANAGVFYVGMLRELAQDAKAPGGTRKDWETLRAWLGNQDNELSAMDTDQISKAWRAYLAIGLAPSHELQPVFDSVRGRFNIAEAKRDRPPVEIIRVFDRLLASDDQIKAKRASDAKAEGEKLAKIIGRSPSTNKKGLWSRQSRSVRGWIFVSVAWAAVALFILTVFDPLDVRRWDWADGRDYLKAMAIMLLPAVAGLLKAAYSTATK